MPVTSSIPSVASSYTGTAEGKQIGQLGKDDFLALLVAQLRDQDPMQPMDNTQFMAQLAQFSALERMQALDDQMSTLLRVEQWGQANGLIGKKVEANGAEAGETIVGTVDSVTLKDGEPALSVDGKAVRLQDVISVVEGEQTQLVRASSLIGKRVEARLAGSGERVEGIVDTVKMSNGNALLAIGGRSVRLSEVVSVAEGDE